MKLSAPSLASRPGALALVSWVRRPRRKSKSAVPTASPSSAVPTAKSGWSGPTVGPFSPFVTRTLGNSACRAANFLTAESSAAVGSYSGFAAMLFFDAVIFEFGPVLLGAGAARPVVSA